MERDWLYNEYWTKERSLKEIGKDVNLSAQAILNCMKKFNIPRRSCAKHTNKTKQKQSRVKAGKNNPMFGIKRPEHSKHMKSVLKGRTFSKTTIEKMSKAKRGICGPKHNKWVEPDKRKGCLNKNIRRLEEMKIWRMAVYKRDNWTCQICHLKGGKLHADHITPLHFLIKEFNIQKPSDAIAQPAIWDINNGRTLCVDCHKRTKTFGSKIRKINVNKAI